jgi:hypothetical protein
MLSTALGQQRDRDIKRCFSDKLKWWSPTFRNNTRIDLAGLARKNPKLWNI